MKAVCVPLRDQPPVYAGSKSLLYEEQHSPTGEAVWVVSLIKPITLLSVSGINGISESLCLQIGSSREIEYAGSIETTMYFRDVGEKAKRPNKNKTMKIYRVRQGDNNIEKIREIDLSKVLFFIPRQPYYIVRTGRLFPSYFLHCFDDSPPIEIDLRDQELEKGVLFLIGNGQKPGVFPYLFSDDIPLTIVCDPMLDENCNAYTNDSLEFLYITNNSGSLYVVNLIMVKINVIDLPKTCAIRFVWFNTLIVATDDGLETIELENVADWSNEYDELSRLYESRHRQHLDNLRKMSTEKTKVESDLEQDKLLRIVIEKGTTDMRKLREEHKNVPERQQIIALKNTIASLQKSNERSVVEKDKRIWRMENELSEVNRYSQELKTNNRGLNRKLLDMQHTIAEERRNHRAALESLHADDNKLIRDRDRKIVELESILNEERRNHTATVDTLQSAIRCSDREIKELESALGKQLALNMKQQDEINKSLNSSDNSADWEKKYRRLLLKVARPEMDGQIAVEMVEELALKSGKNNDLRNYQCASEEKKQCKSNADVCGSTARSERESYEERSQTDREKWLPPKKNGNGKKERKGHKKVIS